MKLTRIDLYLGGVGIEANTPFLSKSFLNNMIYNKVI